MWHHENGRTETTIERASTVWINHFGTIESSQTLGVSVGVLEEKGWWLLAFCIVAECYHSSSPISRTGSYENIGPCSQVQPVGDRWAIGTLSSKNRGYMIWPAWQFTKGSAPRMVVFSTLTLLVGSFPMVSVKAFKGDRKHFSPQQQQNLHYELNCTWNIL